MWLWRRIRGLWKLPDGRDWLRGKLGLVLKGEAMLSKSLIQFSVDGWNEFPPCYFSSVTHLRPHGLQHTRTPRPSPTPGVYPKPCPLSQWCHPTISSSVIHFSSNLQSFPASGSFPMSQFFASGDQSIGVSASASVLPMNTQDWSPLGWTGWISLQSKGLSRVFSNNIAQRHQFFSTELSL